MGGISTPPVYLIEQGWPPGPGRCFLGQCTNRRTGIYRSMSSWIIAPRSVPCMQLWE
jgi:hypothetical protein